MFPGPDRGAPTTLRGWLSDVYFPSLLDPSMRQEAIESLASRLGAKATVDDPLHGRATGLPAIEAYLKEAATWLSARSATFTRIGFTTGTDRDVTEGTLALTLKTKTLDLPIAVVAERRRSREVELRVYCATQSVLGERRKRARLVGTDPELILPPAVGAFLDALAAADPKGAAAAFEHDGSLRDARGLDHAMAGGALVAFVEELVKKSAPGVGLELQRGGAADDGRTCALEYTLVRAHGREVEPQPGLALFARGESGLLSAVRLYGDIEV